MKSDIIPKEPKTRANTGKTKRICRFRDVAFLLKDSPDVTSIQTQ